MSCILARTISAELIKLRGLPAIFASATGTVVAAVALAAGLAASDPAAADAVQILARVIPFVQVGLILIGVLSVAHEYARRQIATTLLATPHRPVLLAGKFVAHLLVSASSSVATVGAGWAAAQIVLTVRGIHPLQESDVWSAVGAMVYLVLIGLVAFTLTILLRSLIPPLVAMLTLVLIVSPLLSSSTEHARWLPDEAGSMLYQSGTDAVLTPVTGTLVLLAWIAVTGLIAAVAFGYRDA
ncbi:MAG TPA: hypothetical protein VK060_13030 [Ruania sp.]|nr:hypothetical protein [Ruania sp.]